jgi:cytoskeletal protein CcmA (bactofilin family)
MKSKRRTIDKFKDRKTSIISRGIQITGSVKGAENIIVHGELEGNIELSGILLLGRTGRINGEITASNVIIEGDFEGKITATEKVEILGGGKYKGDIFTPLITVAGNSY